MVTMRHFVSGRKIHAYDKEGVLKYEICVDDPKFNLERTPGYLTVDMDGKNNLDQKWLQLIFDFQESF